MIVWLLVFVHCCSLFDRIDEGSNDSVPGEMRKQGRKDIRSSGSGSWEIRLQSILYTPLHVVM